MNIRKSVRNLLPEELLRLRVAFDKFMKIKDDRGYGYWAGIHGLPLPISCVHGEVFVPGIDPNFRLFLPWHRAYLHLFELALQDAASDHTITIPYWDWSNDKFRKQGIPKAYSDPIYSDPAGNEVPNPLFKYHVELPPVDLSRFVDETECPKYQTLSYDTSREPNIGQIPTSAEVREVLALNDYGDFSDGLEDLHNRVHGATGGHCGDMNNPAFAAFDPIFWAHHSMIDRLFYLWQQDTKHTIPTNLYNIALGGFGRTSVTLGQVLNTYQLGYEYASHRKLVHMGV